MNVDQEELIKTTQNLTQEVAQLMVDKAHLSAKLTIVNNKIQELTEKEGA